ncbi:MAG TPA: tetraacyldisaccharide 4'-kinase [Bacteroidia bacterium]|nr:tetraacyldisaccharide 4'-kinase [Bacteroidia bacterium]
MNTGLKILLSPLALLYGLVTLVRNRLYDWHILKVHRFDVHTIAVGNLAVGGAGKTPMIEYLIRLLLHENIRIATLSRGYKRKTSGYILAGSESSSDDIGDEPLIFKSKYPVDVAVDANRVSGIRHLLKLEPPPRLILLDDAFQHRSLRCGLNILISDYYNLYFNDMMLPAGTLREFRSGVQRADIIVISKTPDKTSPVEIRTIIKDINPRAHQRVFFSYLKYGELYAINDPAKKMDTLNELFRYLVISFAGIANASTMTNYLKEYASELRHLPFPDHHEYQEKDLEDIERFYQSFEGGNKILVTTEKDLMRLKHPRIWQIVSRMNIFILPVEVSFKDKEQEFNELILKYVRTNRIQYEKYT